MERSLMRKLGFASLLVAVSMSLVSCSSNSSSSNNSSSIFTPALVPVTMSVQDTPPAGVAVLSFEIQVTSASLTSSNPKNPAVTLLAKPANVELEHLQSEAALLGNLNVPADTYSSLTATFANPQLVIFNATVAPITVGTTVCAAKSPCKLTPALTSATTTVSTAPFPITLSANSPLGFLLHFDVNSSVDSTLLTVTPTVDVKELIPTTAGVIHQEHLAGTVTALSSPNFTLQPGLGSPTAAIGTLPPAFNIATNSSTVYDFDDKLAATCSMPGFACLATGQTVNATVSVLADGSLLATQITLYEQHNSPAFEGTVVSVDTTKNTFQMALMGGQWSPTAVPTTSAAIGVIVTVSVPPSTPFEIDKDGFTIPSGLTFAAIGDLVAGQTVEIQPSAVGVGPNANTLTLTTSRVRLDETQVTAHVASIDTSVTPPTAFTIGTLPPLYSAFTAIKVQTVTTPLATQFQNVTGVAGLSTGDLVSVGGLLFNTGATPTLVAEKVLKRVQCTAAVAGGATLLVPCALPPQ